MSSATRNDLYPLGLWGALLALTATALFVPTAIDGPLIVHSLGHDRRPDPNAFDAWARDRGGYYSLEWKPRPGAEGDESFRPR